MEKIEADFDDFEIDESQLQLPEKPTAKFHFDRIVFVANIPVVTEDRLKKLEKRFLQNFTDPSSKLLKIVIPRDGPDSPYKSYGFFHYETADQANAACAHLDGALFDKKHCLEACKLDKVTQKLSAGDSSKPNAASSSTSPPPPSVVAAQEAQLNSKYELFGRLKSWLTNENALDQCAIVAGFAVSSNQQQAAGIEYRTGVYWQSKTELTPVVPERNKWTESYVRWSPRGSFLATMHQQGVALWGGPELTQFDKFQHARVAALMFSPCERYLVTCSAEMDRNNKNYAIWDIVQGRLGRPFAIEPPPSQSAVALWPHFKWSPDDQFFASRDEDQIRVYNTHANFSLLDKAPIKVAGGAKVKEIEWSPKANILAYWVPEGANSPARVTLLELPSRTEVATKNLYNVASIRLVWQKAGHFLCVWVERYQKKKEVAGAPTKYSGLYTNFEIFRMVDKDRKKTKEIPIDKLELKEQVIEFQWEPIGEVGRFAYITKSSGLVGLCGYSTGGGSGAAAGAGGAVTGGAAESGTPELHTIKTFENPGRNFSEIRWSGQGQHLLLLSPKNSTGSIEFVDGHDGSLLSATYGVGGAGAAGGGGLASVNVSGGSGLAHPFFTDAQFDPTGRYVISYVSEASNKADNGLYVWALPGVLLYKWPVLRLRQFLWRPSPPLLSFRSEEAATAAAEKERQQQMKKRMPDYTRRFAMEDLKASSRTQKELLEKRRAMKQEFEQLRASLRKRYEDEAEQRAKLRARAPATQDGGKSQTEKKTFEFLINFQSQIIQVAPEIRE